MFDKFSDRHIGVTRENELKAMLDTIGVGSVEELIAQVIPQSIRLKKPLALPAQGMSEYEFSAHIRALADRNRTLRSFIGMGYYPCAVPAAVSRNVFENPAWYTSYTPYQAEISQGRLEALLNFQTAVISLTGMEIGNCSLLDEGTAAAEAMLMMFALRSREAVREGRNQLFVDRNIFPQTLDVLLTRSEPFGIELIIDEYDEYEFTGKEFGAIVQYPAANGHLRDYSDFTAAAHAKGALVTAVADLLALALVKAPGEWGADIAVGTAQRLGTPMGFGGPAAGYMATREAFKRHMPGRIIGVSVDRLGNRALRMALQMREQHIKREKATSNICTATALMASMTGFYCVYNGPEGLRRAALTAQLADYLPLLRQQQEAARRSQEAAATAAGLAAAQQQQLLTLLSALQPYAPTAADLGGAQMAPLHLRQQRTALSAARQAARDAAMRRDLLKQQLPESMPNTDDTPLPRPTISQEALAEQLPRITQLQQSARSRLDTLTGQLRALGSAGDIDAQLQQCRQQLQQLQGEYDAIALAMTVLDEANTTLQNRFSPALGARAAEIFSKITAGRYQKVLLSRDLSLETDSEGAQRSVQLLSQGAADQLYLAVRLAICDLVLPEDKHVPLILDDALLTFDDDRLHAALDYLLEESEKRQILLFTCQKREGAYLNGHKNVTLLAI